MIVATSQLGYRPSSTKTLTLVGADEELPDSIPFSVHRVPSRFARPGSIPTGWSGVRFPWPFDIGRGPIDAPSARSAEGDADLGGGGLAQGLDVFCGVLSRTESRWGRGWQGDMSQLTQAGIFHVETEVAFSYPFQVSDRVYDRLLRGYPIYLSCQRSGIEVEGVRPAMHVDDAILDTDGTQIPAGGGWNDAGDARKWLGQTLPYLEALSGMLIRGPSSFARAVQAEINWGNRYFHAMIRDDGLVYEDVGGGAIDLSADPDPWFDNHALIASDNSGNRVTDNIPGTGDERIVRTRANPWVQSLFVRTQAIVGRALGGVEGARCLALSDRARSYGMRAGHDRRTLFLAGDLLAALECAASGLRVDGDRIEGLASELLERQDTGTEGLSGYFLERDSTDAYRAITFPAEPALALLRLAELEMGSRSLRSRCVDAVRRYAEDYLLADATSNPYGVPPYGIYFKAFKAEVQTYRPAGRSRYVRTFIPPWNEQQIAHGTNSVVMQSAYLLARGGAVLGAPSWIDGADRMLQWALGHNPLAMSLFTGIGFRHPVPFSVMAHQVPEAAVVGFIGRPDDSPYLETSPAVEWNTQEIWGLPYTHAVNAVLYLP